jgi:radical SAM superfamily enzyme YgiQ (UPF0313 family)
MLVDNKKKVLLVYPGSKLAGFTYPVGLLYIAQALLKTNIDVSIFHMGVDNIKKLKLDDYLFVGIGMLTGEMISNGLRVAKLVKRYNNKIPIVIGGVHPSLLPEQSLQNEYVDIVVIGEGDRTIQELSLSLMNGQDLSEVKGIAYKDNDRSVVVNPPREFIDMNELEFDLPYELLGKHFPFSSTAPVHTSRGCPYRCSFCYNPAINKRKYRFKSADRVIDEIEYLYNKYNIDSFCFAYEDEFFINPKRVYEIAEFILKKGLKIEWTSFCRFDTFDRAFDKFGEEFVYTLKRSGCRYLSFGAESGSQRLLDEVIYKDIKVGQIIRTVERLKKVGITQRVSFICCFPTETRNDLNATFDVIDRISRNNSRLVLGLFQLIPYPGTTVCELLQREYGYKTPSSLEEWGRYRSPATSSSYITWLPKEYVKMCHNLTLAARYPFYKDFGSHKKYKEFVHNVDMVVGPGYCDYIIAKIQRWRYKNRFFQFMIENLIFNKLVEMRAFVQRYVLRKYLPKSIYNALKRWYLKRGV